MRTILATIFVLLSVTLSAQAQQTRPALPTTTKSEKTVTVPSQFKALFDAYRGWTSRYPNIGYSNTFSNWAYKTVIDTPKPIWTAARNWLFMQTPERFTVLVSAYGTEAKELFGNLYLSTGVHVVFSVPYTADADGMYHGWYQCIGKTKWHPDHEHLIEDRVHTWTHNRRPLGGSQGECKHEYSALSRYYGVQELSADDMDAIGFLSRRYQSNLMNPKFLPAETIRKAIGDLFDPNNS